MTVMRRVSFWTTLGGVCTIILVACGSETITLAPVTESVQTSGNTTQTTGFTSALFGSDDAVTVSSSAEMLAVFNLPEGTATLENVASAAQLLLDPQGASTPIENLPELVNADVAQPAGLLNLADVAVVLTAARAAGEPPSKAELAEQVSRVLDEPGTEKPFVARNVRVVPTVARLGDPGQPGGDALVTSERTEVISQVIDAINGTLASITSGGDVIFAQGTRIVFPGTPDPQEALRVSFDPPLPPSRQNDNDRVFTAAELGCNGTSCFIEDGLEIIPAGIDPAPGDYEVTYTFRYSDGGSGFLEESAVRVLTVFEDNLAPPTPIPTPSPTPIPTPPPTPTPAPALVVDRFEDDLNEDEFLTLREAIAAANEDARENVIELGAGTYRLALANAAADEDEDEGLTGDLDIEGELTIRGAGASQTTIDAAGIDRVFEVLARGTLTLEGVTIKRGSASEGGGIFNGNQAGTVNIVSSIITENEATSSGGGIFNENFGVVNITSSIISNNTIGTVGSGNTFGGGISNSDSNSEVNLVRSTISGNIGISSSPRGGGLSNDGRMSITENSTISDNEAQFGGGIYNRSRGILDVADSTISNNFATTDGGGINDFGGIFNIINVIVSNNTAGANGGGIEVNGGGKTISRSEILGNTALNEGGGILLDGGVTIEVSDSIIEGNFAESGGGIGSFYNRQTANILNSTISGNIVNSLGGGIRANGGAFNISSSTIASNTVRNGGGGGISHSSTEEPLTLLNSTISNNSVSTNGGGVATIANTFLTNVTIFGNSANGVGGGIRFNGLNVTTATIENSIISGNLGANNILDDVSNGGVSTDMIVTHSLVGTASPDVDLSDSSNIVNEDPQFDPEGLKNNGGLTETLGILSDSPAIDAGNNPTNLTIDQRGLPRIVDGDEDGTETVDMGAFEFAP